MRAQTQEFRGRLCIGLAGSAFLAYLIVADASHIQGSSAKWNTQSGAPA